MCRKRPQFWQSDNWYILYNNAPAHGSQWVKEFHAKTRTNVLPHPLYSPDLERDIFLLLTVIKLLQGHRFVSSHEVKVASQEALREVAKNGFQLCFQKLCERC
ncbi:mariner Mos1 transposase [Trichonephila clavipes]|nr:mariner Mos1 transposase [Trichonephila clavipes]